jgi:hypothetical protein
VLLPLLLASQFLRGAPLSSAEDARRRPYKPSVADPPPFKALPFGPDVLADVVSRLHIRAFLVRFAPALLHQPTPIGATSTRAAKKASETPAWLVDALNGCFTFWTDVDAPRQLLQALVQVVVRSMDGEASETPQDPRDYYDLGSASEAVFEALVTDLHEAEGDADATRKCWKGAEGYLVAENFMPAEAGATADDDGDLDDEEMEEADMRPARKVAIIEGFINVLVQQTDSIKAIIDSVRSSATVPTFN